MRAIFSGCYGAEAFPLEPCARYPADVLHPGALPLCPYDFAFWGFPCTPWAGLKRKISWTEIDAALCKFEDAIAKLSDNPPSVHASPAVHSDP